MKRATALATLAALSFTLASVPAFAAEDTNAVEKISAESEKNDTAQLIAKKYENLSFEEIKVEEEYFGEVKLTGAYPVPKNITTLNGNSNIDVRAHIESALSELNLTDSDRDLTISYKVDEFNRYAKVTITISGFVDYEVSEISHEHYIDKETSKEITKSEFETAIQEATESEEETTEQGIVYLPLRQVTEGLASEAAITPVSLDWDQETKSVAVTFGDIKSTVIVGKNVCLVAGKTVELEGTVELHEDRVYVPSTYFTKVFGAKVKMLSDNMVEITLPEEETEATETEKTEETSK